MSWDKESIALALALISILANIILYWRLRVAHRDIRNTKIAMIKESIRRRQPTLDYYDDLQHDDPITLSSSDLAIMKRENETRLADGRARKIENLKLLKARLETEIETLTTAETEGEIYNLKNIVEDLEDQLTDAKGRDAVRINADLENKKAELAEAISTRDRDLPLKKQKLARVNNMIDTLAGGRDVDETTI